MNTVRDIIAAFGGGASLARELGEKPVTVRAWSLPGRSIPYRYWAPIVDLAKRKRVRGLTLEKLADIASQREDAA